MQRKVLANNNSRGPANNGGRLGRVRKCSVKRVDLVELGKLVRRDQWHNNGYARLSFTQSSLGSSLSSRGAVRRADGAHADEITAQFLVGYTHT